MRFLWILYKKLTEKELDIFIKMRINQLREEGAKEDFDLAPNLKNYYERHMADGTFVSEWLRHKIRAIYWKQWKKGKTKFKELKKLDVEEEKAWICANMRNGNWYCSGYFVLQIAFNNKKLRELGYPTFTDFYLKIGEN